MRQCHRRRRRSHAGRSVPAGRARRPKTVPCNQGSGRSSSAASTTTRSPPSTQKRPPPGMRHAACVREAVMSASIPSHLASRMGASTSRARRARRDSRAMDLRRECLYHRNSSGASCRFLQGPDAPLARVVLEEADVACHEQTAKDRVRYLRSCRAASATCRARSGHSRNAASILSRSSSSRQVSFSRAAASSAASSLLRRGHAVQPIRRLRPAAGALGDRRGRGPPWRRGTPHARPPRRLTQEGCVAQQFHEPDVARRIREAHARERLHDRQRFRGVTALRHHRLHGVMARARALLEVQAVPIAPE